MASAAVQHKAVIHLLAAVLVADPSPNHLDHTALARTDNPSDHNPATQSQKQYTRSIVELHKV